MDELVVPDIDAHMAVSTPKGVEEAQIARSQLLAAVRASLRDDAGGASLDSVLGVLGSELELSVRRLLDSRLEEEG